MSYRRSDRNLISNGWNKFDEDLHSSDVFRNEYEVLETSIYQSDFVMQDCLIEKDFLYDNNNVCTFQYSHDY